jgi:hypothetical protein
MLFLPLTLLTTSILSRLVISIENDFKDMGKLLKWLEEYLKI